MSWKCDFCPQRIFTTKTSYTNHIKQCLKSVDSSEELSLEVMMIDSLESENLLNNENNFESIHENSNEDEGEGENEDEDNDSYNAEVEEESLTSDISHSNSSEELSLEVMMIDSLESENLLNNENNFESIHENSNEDEGEGENEDEDNDSYNAEVEEESLTSDISHSSVSFFENMKLSNSEPENYSFNNYASDYNNICEEAEPIEFSNNAYADLMAFVTNYNLSNEATNAVIRFFNEHSNLHLSPFPKNVKKGRELMEKMKIPTLTSKKHKILTHNNIDYYLFYHPVLNCIKNILSISDISQNFTLRFENFKYKGEKAYSEQYTGNWWKNTEASLPHGSNLLSIILYSDTTTTDTLGKSSLHPIYISIGNISTKRRNKSDAKQLLGYLPILKAKDKSEKKSKDFKKLVRLTFHNSMKFLLDPLFAEKGIDLEVDNKTFWFFPRISTIICDWPEAATFSLVYKSTNSNFPCHFCLISKTLLADTNLSDVTFQFTQALLQKQDSSLVNKIDNRLSKIPRFQKFQMFTNGLQSISRMTAKEYRILMKVMVFVVDNLYKENENNVENFVENKKLSEVYAKWNKMYMMSRSEIFTESDFENFRKDTFEWAKLFVEIFKPYSRSKLKFPKFHSWIYHIFESICQFGIINGYTTETYESLHKDFVKILYRMSNKKNVEDQIMKTTRYNKHPLFAEKGIDLEVDNKTFWFFPRISTIICDWPEAATFSLVYKSTNSNFPCHFCLISKTLLADTNLSDVTFRNNENMQEYFYNNAGQDMSLENIPNYFWSLPSINVYSATVPDTDRMHHLDLGLFHYQIKFTQALLQKQDKTYESLHKDFVKILYRMSNKKNVEDQIMKTLKRQDIINVINKKQKKKKPTKLLNFSSKLFETKLTEANIYFCEKMNDPNINDNIIKNNILEVKNIKECDIIIYSTATLENGSIIRAKNKFHDKPWFSNVAISMDSNESSDYQSDEGLCYGKILLMAKIEIEEKPPLNLALVQWYDFKFEKNSYLYNCPLLKLVELYNLIPIETIDNIVHIIPRFDEDNEYFVNKYIS
ncbi:hypothetical protein Glove_38g6 [Diversispora epigaea]|uniref:C2H2-type domain-containing protein n=1 Tax=Diversispora epigaea TaxID=1348612 RepID=A0A397JFX6_9GLOM|nr:hypothetical protein Glove_38g6 [Diversispora epigaea]